MKERLESTIMFCVVKPEHRQELRDLLHEKLFDCNGSDQRSPYFRFMKYELRFPFYYTVSEAKGTPFVHFDEDWLPELRVLPREAIYTFLTEVFNESVSERIRLRSMQKLGKGKGVL